MKAKRGQEGPDPIDVHVGSRVRLRRVLLGLTQEMLAVGLGITFQQVQKYEHGSNRISASRLYSISRQLSVPVPYFFEGLEGAAHTTTPGVAKATRIGAASELSEDLMGCKETLKLLNYYYSIADANLRLRFTDLLRSAANSKIIN